MFSVESVADLRHSSDSISLSASPESPGSAADPVSCVAFQTPRTSLHGQRGVCVCGLLCPNE